MDHRCSMFIKLITFSVLEAGGEPAPVSRQLIGWLGSDMGHGGARATKWWWGHSSSVLLFPQSLFDNKFDDIFGSSFSCDPFNFNNQNGMSKDDK